jgi:hypothetical protein
MPRGTYSAGLSSLASCGRSRRASAAVIASVVKLCVTRPSCRRRVKPSGKGRIGGNGHALLASRLLAQSFQQTGGLPGGGTAHDHLDLLLAALEIGGDGLGDPSAGRWPRRTRPHRPSRRSRFSKSRDQVLLDLDQHVARRLADILLGAALVALGVAFRRLPAGSWPRPRHGPRSRGPRARACTVMGLRLGLRLLDAFRADAVEHIAEVPVSFRLPWCAQPARP